MSSKTDLAALFRPNDSLLAGLAIRPYEPFQDGLLMAWPTDQPVDARIVQTPTGFLSPSPGVEITIRDCEQAAWLTLEIDLSWDQLETQGVVGLGMDVACNPITRAGLQLRIPQAGGPPREFESRPIFLHPTMQRLQLMVTLPLDAAFERVEGNPRLILWMSHEAKVLSFDRLFVL